MKALRKSRRGYTLVELMVSMAAGAVLLVGLSSTLYIGGQIANTPRTADAAIDASRALGNLADELQYAIHITARSDKWIEFAAADSNGDNSPDVIRYEWSGAAGAPLLRTFNRGAAVEVVGNVYEFSLAYAIREKTEQFELANESSEQVLASWDGGARLAGETIENRKWRGEYFQPALPNNALSWKVTKAKIKAKREGDQDGETMIQLRTAARDKTPTSDILEQVSMLENTLSDSFQWKEFAYRGVNSLKVGDGLCLVLRHVSADKSCRVEFQNGGVSAPNCGWLKSGNRGASWTVETNRALQFYIYGTYATPAPPETIARAYLTGVHVSLRAGADPTSRVETSVQVANSPELLSACWSLDFDRDPTAVDANFDGAGDWTRRDNLPFDSGTLTGGVWRADATLDTRPNNDFSRVTTAEVRFRNTSVGGNGAVFWINADWSGGRFAPLFARIQLQPDSAQTLTVCHKLNDSTELPLAAVPGLGNGFQLLRLVILPDKDLVNIKVNGEDQGTFRYNTLSPTRQDRFATIQPSGSGAEFDYVSVRVAE